eukprot:gene17725-9388_t
MRCMNSLENLTETTRMVLIIFNVLIAVLATLSNALAVYVFMSSHTLLTRFNSYLISMMMTDFLVGTVLEPLFIVQLASTEMARSCNLNDTSRFIMVILTGVTMGTIALISYDRFIHLSKTVRYNLYIGNVKVAVLTALSWLLPIAITFCKYLDDEELVYCTVVFVYAIIMVIITIISYYKIVRTIRKKRKQICTHLAVGIQKQPQIIDRRLKKNTNEKAIKMVSIVIACFIIFIAPISVFHGISASSKMLPKREPASNMEVPNRQMILFYSVAMTISMLTSTQLICLIPVYCIWEVSGAFENFHNLDLGTTIVANAEST